MNVVASQFVVWYQIRHLRIQPMEESYHHQGEYLLAQFPRCHIVTRLEVCIRVYSTRRTSLCAKDNDSLAPTAKWGLPFILEWSELYELRPGLYEPLFGAGWLQETSGRPVKLRVVRLVTWGWMQLQRYNPLFTSDRLDPATCLLRKRRRRRSTPIADRYTVEWKAYQWLDRRKLRTKFFWRCVGHLIFMLLDALF
jgi:hypothetical protein